MPPYWFEADYEYFSPIFEPVNITFRALGINTTAVVLHYTSVNGKEFTGRTDFIFMERTIMSGYYSKTGSWKRTADIFSGAIAAQNQTGIIKCYFEITTEYGVTNWPSPSDALKIKITDMNAPRIIPNVPEEAGLYEQIEIKANITDDVGVRNALVYYRNMTSQTYLTMNLTRVSGDERAGNYSASLPGVGLVGDVFYYIRASDNDNDAWFHNSSDPALVHIKDLTPPQIKHRYRGEIPLGSPVIISAVISDNVMVLDASVDYWFEGGGNYSVPLTRISGDYTFGNWAVHIVPKAEDNILHYRIRATDSSGNTNITAEYVTNLVDSSAPYLIHRPLKVISTNTSIPIRVVAIDDEDVLDVTLYYRGIGESTYTSVPLVLTQGDGKYGVWLGEIPAQAQEGVVYYYVTADDSTNTARLPARDAFKTNVEPPMAIHFTTEDILPGTGNGLLMLVLLVTATIIFVSSAAYEGLKRRKKRKD